MGCGHDYAINGITSAFLVLVRFCLVVIGGQISSKMEMAFLFLCRNSFFYKTMCTITAKQHNCGLLVLKRKLQRVAAGLAFFTVEETSRSIV